MNNSEPTPTLDQTLEAWAGIFTRRSIHDFLTFMHHSNLSMPHLNILMQLYYHGPVSLLALRSTMLTSRAAATQLVDKLVQLSLVERSEDAQDRRVKVIRLTESGRKLVSDSMDARNRWFHQVTAGLSAEDQAGITRALQMLIDAAVKQEDPASCPHPIPGQTQENTAV